MESHYQTLQKLSQKAEVFSSIIMLLDWDKETYMPKGAIGIRSQQIELMSGLLHKERTSPDYVKALSRLVDIESGEIADTSLSDEQRAAVREWRRDYLNEAKLPHSFVEEFAKAVTETSHVWEETKPKSDFKTFSPYLEKLVTLCRKKADIVGYVDHPYDALINYFEPEMTTKVLTALFEKLKIPLTDLLKKIQTKPDPDQSFLKKYYAPDAQLNFGKSLLHKMGFNPATHRLDLSSHPMCIPFHIDDVRLTTRIHAHDLMSNIFSCLHEGGHGLYHRNLPREHFGTPLGQPASYAIDESQSRTWETIIGRSFSLWKALFPLLQETFPENLRQVDLKDFYRAINVVEPSMIRVESDEVTYNLHIMLRFEIEKALIEGSLAIKDIPEAWNEKMRLYLSLTPKAAAEGCMQDIHWSIGAIGYFPTYTLGNLYAAQFFETFTKAHPDWQQRLEQEDLAFIAKWQKENIHRHGRRYIAQDLCKKVTGSALSEEPFIRYLTHKFTPLYHLK